MQRITRVLQWNRTENDKKLSYYAYLNLTFMKCQNESRDKADRRLLATILSAEG